ncbi:MAG: GXGXG motif-containing protein, partial [Proteobacteria bacterium]|nr:GXGXG motif-containing protein [Pseudomonadota bacterium]
MAELSEEQESHRMGMHSEQLAGRSQQIFFAPEEAENFASPDSFEVDFDKRTEIDAAELGAQAVNLRIRELMQEGYGSVVVKNPG